MKYQSIRHISWSVAFAFILLITGCQKAEQTPEEADIPFNFQPTKDETILKLISWEEEGKIDSLLAYLNHRNPTYRYQALHAFTASRYQEHLSKLYPLLKDEVVEVRSRAVYAVGQNANKQSIAHLQEAYNAWDSLGIDNDVNALVLEAIGKCGARPQLEQLAGISTFEPTDSVLIMGQSRGLFQLLLKGIWDEATVEVMAKYFFSPQYNLNIRQQAGYYLMRGRDLPLDEHSFSFGKILRSNDHFTLRTYAAGVMANSGSNKYSNVLVEQLNREKNEQVKLNILRALFKMPYSRVKNSVFKQVDSPNPLISQMAARFFLINGEQDDAAQYWDKVKVKKLDPVTTAYFAAATAKNLPFYYALTRNAAIQNIVNKLNSAKDPYVTAQLLQVLAELPANAQKIISYYKSDAHPAIKSQIVFSIQKAAQVAQTERKNIGTVNSAARSLFNTIIEDKDPGALAAMAYVIRDTSATNFHSIFKKQKTLASILPDLELPRQIETYNEIVQLLNSYGDKSVAPVKAKQFLPFDTDRYRTIQDSTRAIVGTTAGSFTMRFAYRESPISVTNFIGLAEQGYFANKTFHRVVPNFVIQTGCPRGDGYGSQDYVIRSELGPLHYDRPGKVGMASAGNDTESSQWFVTHLPVFHLDGRYTIFGQVTDGMDVVNAITVGDQIKSIKITN